MCIEAVQTGGLFLFQGVGMSSNPRYQNGHQRRKIREWLLQTQGECAICGKPIDKTLKTPHPMSAEVDEIIPVSLGGSPIKRSNVQLAHRICNQRKSNKVDTPKTINLPLPLSQRW